MKWASSAALASLAFPEPLERESLPDSGPLEAQDGFQNGQLEPLKEASLWPKSARIRWGLGSKGDEVGEFSCVGIFCLSRASRTLILT